MYQLKIIEINKIRQHEKLDKKNLRLVKVSIEKEGVLHDPVIVDAKTLTLLDGHHRLNSLRILGAKKIPCVLVDYTHDKKIRVSSRRLNYHVSKEGVLKKALNGETFPPKTTQHFIPHRMRNLNIKLSSLI